MKKTVLIFTLSIILTTALMFSCGGGGGGGVDNAMKELFTISYNANGAESGIVPAVQQGDEDSPQSVQSNTGNLAKSGYLFDGWNTAANGSGTDYAPGASYKGKDITLYAKWAAIFNVQVLAPASPAPALDGAQMSPGVSYLKILGLTARGRTLSNIVIPEAIDGYQVVSIGVGAFQGCSTVTDFSIPETVTAIEDNAFAGCTGITTLTIPRSVTEIGNGTFSGCGGLSSLVLLNPTPPTMGADALEGCTATVSVPAAGVDAYKTAEGWDTYSASIAGYSTEIYTVTFEDQGATTAPSFTSKEIIPPAVTVVELPIPPKKTGFGFDGWFTEPEGAGTEFIASTVVSANIIVYAKWNQNYRYTVTFDDQGATTPFGETSKEVGSPNTTVGTLPSEPANNGYIFGGWNTESDGTGDVFTADTIVSNNITVYANWIPIFTYSVDNSNIKIIGLTSAGKELSSIIVPETIDGKVVTSIGYKNYSNNYESTNLTSVIIGNSVTALENGAFSNCPNLTSIAIGNSVASIGIASGVISEYNTGLNNIIVDNGNPNFSSMNGVLFNKNKTELIRYPIGKSGSNYTIPNSVTSIGSSAFSSCSRLTNIDIPNSVITIGISAFYGCTGLTSITLPNNVTSIESSTFYSCTGLTSITIPSGITIIGERAFYQCTNLANVVAESNSYSIGNYAFYGCTNLINIPSGITLIGAHAFENCTSLTNITVPCGMNDSAFKGCSGLIDVTINDGYSVSAFYPCQNITNFTINSSVDYIFGHFSLPNLTNITVKNPTPPIISDTNWLFGQIYNGVMQSGCPKLTVIKVPAGSVVAYKSDAGGWGNYASLIVADE